MYKFITYETKFGLSTTTKSKQIERKVSRIKWLVFDLRKETFNYADIYVLVVLRISMVELIKLCGNQVKPWELLHCHEIANKTVIVGISRLRIIDERNGFSAVPVQTDVI